MQSLAIFITLFLSAAVAYAEEESNAWTYETGVQLQKIDKCTNDSGNQAVTVSGTPKKYLVNIRAYFDCDSKLRKPWVNEPPDGNATLVLGAVKSGSFSSSCECLKSVTVSVSGRLSKGKVLYVVNGQEVVGHVVLP